MFDLSIFPLSISSGREQHDLAGLLAVTAPRKADRLRVNDLLVLYMQLITPTGNLAPFTHSQQKEILSRLAETYFTSTGSVTAGLRATAVRLNDFILSRNLKAGNEAQTIGILNQVVVHGDNLVVAHNGSTHSYHLNKNQVNHYDDSQGMRGLGIGKQVSPRFYQMRLTTNDLLVICPAPPDVWKQSLAGSPALSFESLRRRLVNNVSTDIKVVALRFTTGRGQIIFWRPSPQKIDQTPTDRAESYTIPQRQASADLRPRSAEVQGQIATDTTVGALESKVEAVKAPPAVIAQGENLEPMQRGIPGNVTPPKQKSPVIEKPKRENPSLPQHPDYLTTFRLRLASLWKSGSRVQSKVATSASKILPRRTEPLMNLSPSVMLAVAILVPVMVVTIATTVYFRAGRMEQFTILLDQAKTYAFQAAEQQDPQMRKQAWTSTFSLIEEAEKYGKSEESANLRRQALAGLDELSGVIRLDFQPALPNSFGANINITRMVATLNEVFLLDSYQGRILSMTRTTSGGYEANLSFSCSPAKAGAALVGPLIDLAELPINNPYRADILGIDASGNLVYCTSDDESFNSHTLALPDSGWGNLTAITTFGETLFVLDPKLNAVYVYYGEKGIYSGKPHLYFGTDIPEMADMIDLAVDQEFLYLLHADGRMTICTSGGVSFGTTRCTDPAPYGDPRAGVEPSPLTFPGAQFIQVQTTQPPDPSLFALDSGNQAIYHLSQRRMNLQHIYMNNAESDFPFPSTPATAFTITPNRRILIALGSQIFIAPLP